MTVCVRACIYIYILYSEAVFKTVILSRVPCEYQYVSTKCEYYVGGVQNKKYLCARGRRAAGGQVICFCSLILSSVIFTLYVCGSTVRNTRWDIH